MAPAAIITEVKVKAVAEAEASEAMVEIQEMSVLVGMVVWVVVVSWEMIEEVVA